MASIVLNKFKDCDVMLAEGSFLLWNTIDCVETGHCVKTHSLLWAQTSCHPRRHLWVLDYISKQIKKDKC